MSCCPDTFLTMFIYLYYEYLHGKPNCRSLLSRLPLIDAVINLLPLSITQLTKSSIANIRDSLIEIVFQGIPGSPGCVDRESLQEGDFLPFNNTFQNLFHRTADNKLISFNGSVGFFLTVDLNGDILNIASSLMTKLAIQESLLKSLSPRHLRLPHRLLQI